MLFHKPIYDGVVIVLCGDSGQFATELLTVGLLMTEQSEMHTSPHYILKPKQYLNKAIAKKAIS